MDRLVLLIGKPNIIKNIGQWLEDHHWINRRRAAAAVEEVDSDRTATLCGLKTCEHIRHCHQQRTTMNRSRCGNRRARPAAGTSGGASEPMEPESKPAAR